MKTMHFPAALVAAFVSLCATVAHAEETRARVRALEAADEATAASLRLTQQAVLAIDSRETAATADLNAKVQQLLRKANEGCWAVADAKAQAECFKALDRQVEATAGAKKALITAFVMSIRGDRIVPKRVATPVLSNNTKVGDKVEDSWEAPNGAATSTPAPALDPRLAAFGFDATGNVKMELVGDNVFLERKPQYVDPMTRYAAAKLLSGGGNSTWKKLGLAAAVGAGACLAGGGIGALARPEKSGDGKFQADAGGLGCAVGAGVGLLGGLIWQFATDDDE